MTLPSQLDARTRRLVTAILSGIAGRFAALVAPLLATPAMLHYFGDADFGLWVTGISITSIAVMADLGIGNGLLTRIAAAHGRSDFAEISKYLSSAYAVLAGIASALLALTLLGFWLLEGSSIILGVFVVFFLGLPFTVFYQFLYGIQRVPTCNALLLLGAAASVLFCLAAIYFNTSPFTVVVSYALPPVLMSVGGAVWFFYAHSVYRPKVGSIEWQCVRDLLKLGSSFFLLSILTSVGLNIDNIIISARVGPEAAAAYAIPMRLGSVLSLVIMALFMPLWATNGEALAKHDYGWVQRSARRMSMLGFALVSVAGIVLIIGADNIIQLWVGRTFDDQKLVLAAAVVTAAAIAGTSPYNMVLNAMGRVNVQIWPWLAFVAVSIALKLVVVAPGTVWPIAAVTGVAYMVTVTPTIFLAARRAVLDAEREYRL